MGCRSGITRRLHSAIATWLSDGTGGFRAVLGLGAFAITRSSRWPNSTGCWSRCLTRGSCAAPLEGELESLLEHSCTLAHKCNSAKTGRRSFNR